ncbi:MAG TPA: TMEM175 family protein [Halomicronema sp.]
MTEEKNNSVVSTSRLEAFSDGVIAIVITLLVLEIKVPVIPPEIVSAELPHKLLELMPKFLGYLTSFLVVGTYWVAHHNALSYATQSNRVLVWLNILFLMCLSFIPFPTGLFSEYPSQSLASVFYGMTLLITAIIFNILWWYIAYGGNLVPANVNRQVLDKITRGGLLGLPFYVLAIVFSYVNLAVSVAIYIGLPIFYIFLNLQWSKN